MTHSNDSTGFLRDLDVPLDDYSQTSERNPSRDFGVPTRRSRFEPVPLLAALASVLCFGLSVMVITPDLKLAWPLEYNGQIIVVGILLGVMNLCTGTVVPHALLLLEARFGKSTLQNYEGLLTNRILTPRVSTTWRVILFVFIALPIGLGVAYKQFSGGKSSIRITHVDNLKVSASLLTHALG